MKAQLACQACEKPGAAYRCPADKAPYCSVACFKVHKGAAGSDILQCGSDGAPAERLCSTAKTETPGRDTPPALATKRTAPSEAGLDAPRPLKRLRDLQWPAEPDLSLWDDPLNRDIPKPLTPAALQAIATSPALRSLLDAEADGADRSLPDLLTAIHGGRAHQLKAALRDALRLAERDGVVIPQPIPTGAPLPRRPLPLDAARKRSTRLVECTDRERATLEGFADIVKRVLEAHREGRDMAAAK